MKLLLFLILTVLLVVVFLGGCQWSHRKEQEALDERFPREGEP